MDISIELSAILIAWMTLIVILSRTTTGSENGSVGLPMAFVFATTFQYCGAFAYLVPGYSHAREGGSAYLASYSFSEATVLAGVAATGLGVLSFTIGCCLTTKIHRSPGNFAAVVPVPTELTMPYRRVMLIALGGFALTSFVLNGLRLEFAALQALTQVGRNAAIVFVCLGATLVVLVDRRRNYLHWLFLAAIIPTAYLVFWGFTSFGFIALTVFGSYWLAVLASARLSSLRITIGFCAITYGCLSLFVAWMTFRDELRAVLWDERADVGARIAAIIDAFSKTELLSPFNFASLDVLNTRLNQYIFIGKAIEWHELFPHLQLHGQSLIMMFLAWVPRAIWPDKPEMGGNRFVAEHTGMRFSDTATFGAGPVFELYVNFQYMGVLVGFAILGFIVRSIDMRGSVALREGRLLDFVRWFTLGIAFVAPLTDFFFIVSTAVASWLVITALRPAIDALAGRMAAGAGVVGRGRFVDGVRR